MVKIIKTIYLLSNILILLTLLVVHFVIKEKSYESSLYFYTFPLPIIISIVLILSVFLGKYRKYNLILASILLVIWLGRSFKMNFSEDIEKDDIEIVFWNASRDNGFSEAFELNGNLPDIMVLTESNNLNTHFLKKSFPKYHFYKSSADLIVFSKTPIKVLKEETSRYHTYMLFFKSNGINMCAVDVQGSTDVPRSWELGFVNKLVEKKPNTIVLGDFNVPYESQFLNTLKTSFNHAFNKKGNGFRETWFWNIPLLSLDHIWVSKDLEILKSEKIGTFESDHAMIKTFIKK